MADRPVRIRLMALSGCPDRVVAERLGCSLRTVRRHRTGIEVLPNALVGTDDEWRLWAYYARSEPFAIVARRFGVSRQAVQQRLRGMSDQHRVGA